MYRYKVNIIADFEVLGDSPSKVQEFVKRFISESKFEEKNIEVKVSLIKGGETVLKVDEKLTGTDNTKGTPKRKNKARKSD